jgi:hypothetical protein
MDDGVPLELFDDSVEHAVALGFARKSANTSAWSDLACGRLEAQQEQEEDTRGAAPCSGSA